MNSLTVHQSFGPSPGRGASRSASWNQVRDRPRRGVRRRHDVGRVPGRRHVRESSALVLGGGERLRRQRSSAFRRGPEGPAWRRPPSAGGRSGPHGADGGEERERPPNPRPAARASRTAGRGDDEVRSSRCGPRHASRGSGRPAGRTRPVPAWRICAQPRARLTGTRPACEQEDLLDSGSDSSVADVGGADPFCREGIGDGICVDYAESVSGEDDPDLRVDLVRSPGEKETCTEDCQLESGVDEGVPCPDAALPSRDRARRYPA